MATPDPSPTVFTPVEETRSRRQKKLDTLLSKQEKYKLRQSLKQAKIDLAALKKANPGVGGRALKGSGKLTKLLLRLVTGKFALMVGAVAGGIYLLERLESGDFTAEDVEKLFEIGDQLELDEPPIEEVLAEYTPDMLTDQVLRALPGGEDFIGREPIREWTEEGGERLVPYQEQAFAHFVGQGILGGGGEGFFGKMEEPGFGSFYGDPDQFPYPGEVPVTDEQKIEAGLPVLEESQPTGSFTRGLLGGTMLNPQDDPRVGPDTQLLRPKSYSESYTPSGNIGGVIERRVLPDQMITSEPQTVDLPQGYPDEGAYLGGDSPRAEDPRMGFPDPEATSPTTRWERDTFYEGWEPPASNVPWEQPQVAVEEVKVDSAPPGNLPQPVDPGETIDPYKFFGQDELITEEVLKATTSRVDGEDEGVQQSHYDKIMAEVEAAKEYYAELRENHPTLIGGAELLGETAWNITRDGAKGIYNIVTDSFSGDGETETDGTQDTSVYYNMDAGNFVGANDPIDSNETPQGKDIVEQTNKADNDAANVARIAEHYNLNPNITDTLSQIEKNSGVLRAASVMLGVNDISNNYRDMSIGQLRLARDIVEDLNEGGSGPWVVWHSPDGTDQITLPSKGRDSKPPKGYTRNTPDMKARASIRVKNLIKNNKPWDAYNELLRTYVDWEKNPDHDIAASYMTSYMQQIKEFPSSYTWPTLPDYVAWQKGTDINGKAYTDDHFEAQHGWKPLR